MIQKKTLLNLVQKAENADSDCLELPAISSHCLFVAVHDSSTLALIDANNECVFYLVRVLGVPGND